MNFITKRHMSRRTFLRGSGVAIALPLLEAMLPAQTPLRQTAGNPKTRFTGIFFPHGMAPGYWVPKGEGDKFEFTPIMQPLEPYRDRVVILSGLWSKSAESPPGVTGADHWVASAYLCANRPKKTVGTDVYNGTTIDQIIAQKIGQDTLLPSLELAIDDLSGSSSSCGQGYSCAYTNSISWPSPTRSNPMEINPQVVFERLFGDGGSSEERRVRREQDRSILDLIRHSLASFRKNLGPADRARVDQYLEDIRDVERRLQVASKAAAQAPASTVPAGVPDSFDEHIKLQFDLNALAFQGDITRVSTLLGARDLTQRSYPESGTAGAFHQRSHHLEVQEGIREFSMINRYHVACLAYFVDKLKKTADGDGSLLDHSLILYGTNMGNGNQHVHYDVPHVLAGGASGRLRGGRHLAYPAKTITTGNLLLSILDMFDIHQESIGDSTGRLERL